MRGAAFLQSARVRYRGRQRRMCFAIMFYHHTEEKCRQHENENLLFFLRENQQLPKNS